jgi:predicted DCC family thiol-disulfide oxidoreductase YuxK
VNDDGKAIILFDGVCNFCNGFVPFIIRNDPAGYFRLGALQSDAGRQILTRHGLPADHLDSLVLVEGGRAHLRSTAALRIARGLGFPWWLGYYAAIWIPRPLRDAVYKFIANRRYRWFGRRETCAVPTPETRSRFVMDLS